MTSQAGTLDKLRTLESLYSRGYQSDVIDLTLNKIMALESARSRQELCELQANLKTFEEKYQIKSEDFYTRFHAGEFGDDADFFEWSALYDMAASLRERLQSLESEA
ncbi:MAG: hypothetical protein B6I38_05025 [Anaerolineaceae bacterium 4572_5.1]|nr:MAG: hypothetical protein B6I38_05025 [Anaerolineaceae bacterium 4572_5.1]RLD03310.1 MAG: hypothetical protein DRI56_12705 [Chloroflexota bacterium]